MPVAAYILAWAPGVAPLIVGVWADLDTLLRPLHAIMPHVAVELTQLREADAAVYMAGGCAMQHAQASLSTTFAFNDASSWRLAVGECAGMNLVHVNSLTPCMVSGA